MIDDYCKICQPVHINLQIVPYCCSSCVWGLIFMIVISCESCCSIAPWPLTCSPGYAAQHIVTSWVVCVSHIKRLGKIRTVLQGRQGKHFERPVGSWPLIFHSENGAWHIVSSCAVCMPHMKWFNQIGTEPQSRHDNNPNNHFKWRLWPRTFMEPWNGHNKYLAWPLWPMPMTFWNGTCDKHFIRSMSGVIFMKFQWYEHGKKAITHTHRQTE